MPQGLRLVSQGYASRAPLRSVGAKAASLARVAGEGIPVPGFFVIPSAAFARHLRENRIPWPSDADAGGADTGELWASLRQRIRASPIGAALGRQVIEGYGRLCLVSGHRRVAVRSSGDEEDSQSASFAGQFSSVLNLDGSTLLDAVKDCWASYVSERSIRYRVANGLLLPPLPTFAVIVQTQVFSERAGVAFTVHPLDSGRRDVYIEANFGSGESIVGGLATPDNATVSRSGGEVLETVIATKRRMTVVSRDTPGTQVVEVEESRRGSAVLTLREIQEIFGMALRIEQLMEEPQDIEWAYDAHQLWILQARPITTLGSSR